MRRTSVKMCIPLLMSVIPIACAEKGIELTLAGRYNAGASTSPRSRAEVAAYDPATKRIFSTNGDLFRIDVLDISNPASPALLFSIPISGTIAIFRIDSISW